MITAARGTPDRATYALSKTAKRITFQSLGAAHPPRLPLPNHVHRFVSLYRSMISLKFLKALFRLHPSFDGPVILFQHVVQVQHRPVPAPSPQD